MSEESGNLSEGTASESSIRKPDKVSGSERDNIDVGDNLTSDSGAGSRRVSEEASLSNNQFIKQLPSPYWSILYILISWNVNVNSKFKAPGSVRSS